MTIITRIGRDHIIISDDGDINDDDDYESRRRSRIRPYNTLTVNKANNNSSNYCPQCKRATTGGKLVNLLYDKELSAFICPVCSYVRHVNPTNRNEMSPPGSTTATEPGIPTLDGLTEQQALERETGGVRRKKPIIRSIGDPRLRSQYSSSSSNLRFGDGGGVDIQADAETRAWAQNHNASIVAYSEKVLQDSNIVSSKELKWRDKF
jgi:hypothetical protein